MQRLVVFASWYLEDRRHSLVHPGNGVQLDLRHLVVEFQQGLVVLRIPIGFQRETCFTRLRRCRQKHAETHNIHHRLKDTFLELELLDLRDEILPFAEKCFAELDQVDVEAQHPHQFPQKNAQRPKAVIPLQQEFLIYFS